jgi:hypothetical protein
MTPALSTSGWFAPLVPSAWRDVVQPKEHGSWSLAFEPVALGLLAAPSPGGAWFWLAVAAGFFARRPLRIACGDANPARRAVARSAVAVCAAVAVAATAAAGALAGHGWLLWLAPAAVCGGFFLWHDLKNDGRDELAEVAGSAAFAFLPAAFAALAGWSAGAPAALGLAMCARSVPTVIFVRAMVRGRKSGRRTLGLAGAAALAAALALTGLASAGFLSWMVAALWGGLFLARVAIGACVSNLRAKTLGMVEAILGVAFVLTLAVAWQ